VTPATPRRIAPLLAPLAGIYAAGLGLRNLTLTAGHAAPLTPPVPTIGVGNLSAGGTGKTSMVSWLVGELESAGLRVAILSRGFRRPDPARSPEIVSRGSGPLVSWERAGDEPWLLANRHPGAIVVVGGDRAKSALLAAGELGANVLVLDDAFQQRRVRCRPSILMVDAAYPPWKDHLLPWGRLREPLRAARRADLAVLVSDTDPSRELDPAETGRGAAAMPVASWFGAARRARAVVDLVAGSREEAEWLRGRRVWLLSGIGNPRGFEGTARALGVIMTGHRVHPDHHRFSPDDLARAAVDARRSGAEMILTTEKDAVRLHSHLPAFARRRAEAPPDVRPGGSRAAGGPLPGPPEPTLPLRYLEIELRVGARVEIDRDGRGAPRNVTLAPDRV